MMKNCTAAPVREAGSSPSKLKAKIPLAIGYQQRTVDASDYCNQTHHRHRPTAGGQTPRRGAMNHSPVISTIGPASASDQLNNNLAIIVHINEPLDNINRNGLQAAILEDKAVYSAEFCPLRYHLHLVQYDRTKLNSRDALSKVVVRNLSAQIVGPI
jgi:hypothetical protein